MSNTISTPASQPSDLVRRFEPARAVCAPKQCDRREGCWVVTGKAGGRGTSAYRTYCEACLGTITIAGNEAKHAAALRRCMVAQHDEVTS